MKPGKNGGKSVPAKSEEEVRFQARAVSRGVAIGKLVCLFGENRQFFRIDIDRSQIEKEAARFKMAFGIALRQLRKIRVASGNVFNSTPAVFEAHLKILEDGAFLSKIESAIKQKKVNAEWAVKLITDEYIARFKAIHDEHFRERYIDVEDVAERLQSALGGRKAPIKLDRNSIVAASELRPSTLVELSENAPKAIITENGGWTSHTFILAREIGLPAVTGLKKLLRRVKTGDTVIVDGYNGQIILHPTSQTLKKYKVAAERFDEINYDDVHAAGGAIRTLDGRDIVIRANFDIPASFRKAKRLGAQGIGLYRSEFLFNQFKGYPSEAEQTKAYCEIADFAGEDGAKIRTFDLSSDQLPDHAGKREKNPSLGLRAIRLSLAAPKQMRIQIRALLQSAHGRKIDIVIPMVSGVTEIRAFKTLIQKEKASLKRRGIKFGEPDIGVMIEVPSAVFGIKQILEEVDCLCMGTNDLVQYMLAVDRDNESVADWFRTLHPAVIQALSKVISAASAADKPLVICGEMAGSPFYVPLLIGLGATQLSMNVNSILRIRKVISGIAYEETLELVAKIADAVTADEVESITAEFAGKRWAHLFPADQIRMRKLC